MAFNLLYPGYSFESHNRDIAMHECNKFFVKVSIGWISFWMTGLLLVQPVSAVLNKLAEPMAIVLLLVPPFFLLMASVVYVRFKQRAGDA